MIRVKLTIEQVKQIKDIAHRKGLLLDQYLRLLAINAIKLNNEE